MDSNSSNQEPGTRNQELAVIAEIVSNEIFDERRHPELQPAESRPCLPCKNFVPHFVQRPPWNGIGRLAEITSHVPVGPILLSSY